MLKIVLNMVSISGLLEVNGRARFFEFPLIIEGTTVKALQFIMPLELIYNRNFGFIEHKNVF